MSGGAPEGNENSAKGKDWRLAIKRALARRGEGDYRRGLDDVATKVVEMAAAGDTQAWKEIGDRFDGKATQGVELTGEGGGPISVTQITRRVVDGTGN